MNESEEQNNGRQEIHAVAQAILAGTTHPIDGIRLLSSLRYKIGQEDSEVFYLIVALDSDSDTFPRGDFRDECSPAYLVRKDKEMDEFVSLYLNDLHKACREILDSI